MDRLFLALGALSGFVSVAAGAFGAHALKRRLPADLLAVFETGARYQMALKRRLPADLLAVFETGARYQMYHALALVAVALVIARASSTAAVAAGWCFVAGTVLFSGSLYALALSGVRVLGAVTPLGGLAFLAGWLALAWAALRGS
jgi:uncharacterized membrane protein YgdD (TMEM256/DUF423 family)